MWSSSQRSKNQDVGEIREVYPLHRIKHGKELPLSLLESGDYRDAFIEIEPARGEGDYFVWDGKRFFWKDREAGNLALDFLSPKMRYRFERMNKAQEPLLRATGWKSTEPKTLFDLTAGLGRDSGLLLFAGFSVTMFERNPILQPLLTYALLELQKEAPALAKRIKLQRADAIPSLQDLSLRGATAPDVVYLDPMYPARKKSALVKKELRIIRNLVGNDEDSEALLTAALSSGTERVVVKRPAGAAYVGERMPNHTVESPNTRYDVYLPNL